MKVNYLCYEASAENVYGEDIRVQILVRPAHREYKKNAGMIEVPEFKAIRFFSADEIVFQVQGTTAHNLIVDLFDAINESKVGAIPGMDNHGWQ